MEGLLTEIPLYVHCNENIFHASLYIVHTLRPALILQGLYHFKSGIPDWSDATGKISQPRDKFILPNTWKWKDKEFNVRKEFSIPFELKREDFFEYQTKEQYADWSMAESSWHDIVSHNLK